MNTGGVRSSVQVTLLDVVAVLPHASVAVKTLVCDALQLDVVIAPSTEVIVGVPQPSVAVALPSAASIAVATGLHPNVTLEYVPVKTGGVTSTVHTTVLEMVTVLPQPSVAVKTLVCDALHPDVVIAPSLCVITVVLHVLVAVALPSAASIEVATGLHPSVISL